MDSRLEAKIQKEIRRRAFERADLMRQERQHLAKTQHTLAALQEVTGLHRHELESIAAAVKRSLQGTRDDFFSIKMQMMITFSLLSLIVILVALLTLI
jgi:hypothetical protein